MKYQILPLNIKFYMSHLRHVGKVCRLLFSLLLFLDNHRCLQNSWAEHCSSWLLHGIFRLFERGSKLCCCCCFLQMSLITLETMEKILYFRGSLEKTSHKYLTCHMLQVLSWVISLFLNWNDSTYVNSKCEKCTSFPSLCNKLPQF